MAGVGSLLSEKKLDRSLSSHRIAVLAKSLIDSSHGLFNVSRHQRKGENLERLSQGNVERNALPMFVYDR